MAANFIGHKESNNGLLKLFCNLYILFNFLLYLYNWQW